MNLLDKNPLRFNLIKTICTLEHESLIRLHTGTSELSPKMATYLEMLGITHEDYLDYSSEAYFEFQRVLEDPNIYIDMPPIFMAVILDIIEAFREEPDLQPFQDELPEFGDEIIRLLKLRPTNLNLN